MRPTWPRWPLVAPNRSLDHSRFLFGCTVNVLFTELLGVIPSPVMSLIELPVKSAMPVGTLMLRVTALEVSTRSLGRSTT